MFQKRLTWFWVMLTTLALVIVGRLVQIQVVHADEFEVLAEQILTRQPDYITAPRGTIHDRNRIPLVSDEPASDVCIHYALLEDDPQARRSYLIDVARDLRRRGDYPADYRLAEIADELETIEVPRMWTRLKAIAGVSQEELDERAARIRAKVAAILRACGPTVRMIREQRWRWPMVENVSNQVALAVRLELENFPWIRVMPGTRRVGHDADALVHLLGRVGAASAERIKTDALREDELRGLRRTDQCGISGIERVADTVLRGRRGKIVENYDGQIIERIDPIAGRDVYLTIDLPLQEKVLEVLEEAVKARPASFRSGAAAVVIDVDTREVLALASYPVYAYDEYRENYTELRRDKRRDPLMFRAVRAQYPPGSICKAIALVGGLHEGVITPQSTITCTGHLLPERQNMFRCWIYKQYHSTHGPQTGEDAVRNSCNIYFYKVGERLGPGRLCEWFLRFGLGRTQGTGLIEETPAIVPTEEWLMNPRRANPRRYQTADAWNFAIGQGEVTATPLQAANVAATIAAGFWAPVRLCYDETGQALGEPLAPTESFDEGYLRVLRRGMWRVVNEQGGTAYRYAHMKRDDYHLCGKTGSAQTTRKVIRKRYIFEWPDGERETVVDLSLRDALTHFGDEKPRLVDSQIVELFPHMHEDEGLPAHAWFIGFTQAASTSRGARPSGKVYAISVIVEYGASGGHVAAPVARQIAEYLLDEK